MQKKTILGFVGALFTAATAHAGWEYTAVTKATGGQHADMVNNQVHALIDGPKARFEFVESSNPVMAAGNYFITEDAGQTVYLVNPAEKTYSAWKMDAMLGLAGGVMGMMNMKVTDQKIEKLLEEDGGRLLGQPTTHYKFRTAYTMEMNLMGRRQTTSTVSEEDLWTTTALTDAAATFAPLRRNMKTGNAELDKLIAEQLSKARGFPLKIISTRNAKGTRGQPQASQVIMEVTALKPASPAASQFKPPADYTAHDMAPLGAGLGGATDKSGGENPLLKLLQQQLQKQ
jgi:hypothetical protein